MEDKNNNLGDFFRKKFDDFDESGGDWMRPDRAVRDEVLQQIDVSGAAKPNYAKFILIAIIGLFLLATFGYIFYLQQQVVDLKTALQIQNEQSEASNMAVASLEKKYLNEKTRLLLKSEQLQCSNDELVQREKDLDGLMQSQQSAVLQLQEENRILQKKINDSVLTPIAKNNVLDEVADAKENKLKMNLVQKLPALLINPFTFNENYPLKLSLPTQIRPLKSNRKRFEIGYEYALLGFDMAINRTFENQRLASESAQTNKISTPSHGFYFAWSPKKNWWIRTGLRNTSIQLQRRFVLGLAYNRTNETTRPGEPIRNELLLKTSTAFTEIKSAFDISIERGQELQEGDLLEVRIQDHLSLKYMQIPLGIEYFYGSGKLTWLFQGGFQYNRISFGDYRFITTVEARGRILPVDRRRILSQAFSNKQFLSTYAGLGLDYQIFNGWHARGSFNYHYNIIKNSTNEFPGSSKRGTALKLSLNYRF
ncbi:MAG: hypothetical protein DHS20C18_25680 [Saprospiraceae bacterium]|nr:MAG: hypothetical protein DHS20C18_25680 [Saprospiraceae bacterium]